MIETVIEKSTAETSTREQESPMLPQEKLGPPRDEWEKRTKAEGSCIDLSIATRGREYIDCFVYLRGIPVRHRGEHPHRYLHYRFTQLDVEELNDIVVKGIPVRSWRSQRIMPGLYWHEYEYTEENELNVYGTVREIHRTFGKG